VFYGRVLTKIFIRGGGTVSLPSGGSGVRWAYPSRHQRLLHPIKRQCERDTANSREGKYVWSFTSIPSRTLNE
jgi:hypothetical protein